MPTIQNIQKTVEFPQVQFFDKDNVFALAFVLGFFPGSFNVDITRATVLTIVGESVRSLLFVIMLMHLVTGRISQYKQRDYRFMTMISKSWVANFAIFQRHWRLAHPCCFVDQLASGLTSKPVVVETSEVYALSTAHSICSSIRWDAYDSERFQLLRVDDCRRPQQCSGRRVKRSRKLFRGHVETDESESYYVFLCYFLS